ncbi:hypothetical protein LTR86_008986 [Recurvomyces mirabilis]|nr:hypothetical protein LTR86_008986 [Recurvomyces mirabilis]
MADNAPNKHDTNKHSVEEVDFEHLISQARDGNEADRELTLRQALRQYKAPVAWAMFLSLSLVMEGFDLVTINSFYGLEQFQNRFGVPNPAKPGTKLVSPAWQSGLSNSALVGQIAGLAINMWAQDRFGNRSTMMFFLVWMALAIFIPFFAPNLSVLAFGEAMCGVSWGVFQTLSTTYACEIVPTVLRPYVTSWVCMCWGTGILLSSGVIRAIVTVPGDLAWRLPFALQWVWPVPLLIGTYFAPESPWSAVRRNRMDLARKSLRRLLPKSADKEQKVEAQLGYIRYTTELERAETEGARFIDCFKGTNLRRTEINCMVWAIQILCGNALLNFSVVFLESAGFTSIQAFDINIALSACYIIGGVICWCLFPHFGRATIYMSGNLGMMMLLVVIGGLAFSSSQHAQVAIAILFVVSTLINLISTGPGCYPIVAETPSGRLRYKTIAIGRVVYNLTGIVQSCLTPRMVSPVGWGWGAKTALFYAGTNLICNIWCWFRLPETKDRTFGEIDLLFENRVPARKFVSTSVDQFSDHVASTVLVSEKEHMTVRIEEA